MHLVITSKTRVLVYLLGLAVGASKGGVGFLAVWQKDVLGGGFLFCFDFLCHNKEDFWPLRLFQILAASVSPLFRRVLAATPDLIFFPCFEVEYQKVLTSD